MQTQFKSLPAYSTRRCKVETEIYGESYQLAANSDPDYVRQLAHEVDRRMREAAVANPHLGPMRVALLALMELADEVNAIDRAIEKQQQNVSKRCVEIERDIEQLLGVA